jgi:hypothetical protein
MAVAPAPSTFTRRIERRGGAIMPMNGRNTLQAGHVFAPLAERRGAVPSRAR